MFLPPALGMYTRLTGSALNGSMPCWILSTKRILASGLSTTSPSTPAVRAPSVALGHPPHAHQRVGARPEHQLLQTADPRKVPRLRRREDPLPQPPYVRLRRTPVNLAPRRGSRPLVRSPRRSSRRPTCPRVPGHRSSCSSQAHLTASAPFRVRARSPVSGRLSTIASLEEAGHSRPGFPLPFGCRHSLLGHHIPAEGLGLPHGRLTGTTAPDLDGGYRVSHA